MWRTDVLDATRQTNQSGAEKSGKSGNQRRVHRMKFLWTSNPKKKEGFGKLLE